ncbi:MAG: alanine racemase [Chlamydia sp. 32-24]|nr:MAG: alanine racemase [Chlamydia sp. 32-24]
MDEFDLRNWPQFSQAGGALSTPAIVDQIQIDSRRIDSPRALFIALPGKTSDGHHHIHAACELGAKYVIVKKGKHFNNLPEGVNLLQVDDPLEAFQEIASCYRKTLPTKIVGITGSYGKTMVKDLLLALLQNSNVVTASPESFNSQIGVPLSLLTIRRHHKIALIEAGISKKNEMDRLVDIVNPDYTILTHIGKKHVTTLGDLSSISKEIFKFLQFSSTQWHILPKMPHTLPFIDKISGKHYFWNDEMQALPHASFTTNDRSLKMPYQIRFPNGEIYQGHTTFGFYYFTDLLNMCIKAAWLLGVTSDAIAQTLRCYLPEPTRTEIWKTPLGTTIVNDIYSSDPQSVDQSLKYFERAAPDSRRIFAFSGLRNKNVRDSDLKRVGTAIALNKIKLLHLIGEHNYSSLIDEVRKKSPQTEISYFPSQEDLLKHLKSYVKSNDVVLFKGEKKFAHDQLTEALHDSITNNQCVINLAAVESNLKAIRNKLAPSKRIMVMVKALAYGTDDVQMAKFLENCQIDILGVSYVDEGVALKRSGIRQDIFVINAAIYEIAKIVKWELEVAISNEEFIYALEKQAKSQGKIHKVHLHIDTGMNRFGCKRDEAIKLAKLVIESPHLELEGVMTHFPSADNPAHDSLTLTQAEEFSNLVEEMRRLGINIPWLHAENSSASIRFNFPQFNMVRIGLAVYGLYPSPFIKSEIDLRLALSLFSRIVGINRCKKGETISYGREFLAKKDHIIAVLPIGYFDGIHRHYSGKGSVIIRGQKAPMVGKICMDYMMVDITDVPNAAIGDAVLIFGEDEYGHYLSPEDFASQADSIVYELITCLGPRIQRIFVYEENNEIAKI